MNRNANLKPSPKLTPVWAAPIWQKGGVLGRNPFLKFLNSWGDYGDQRNLQKITQETRTLHLNYMNYLIKKDCVVQTLKSTNFILCNI
jgi:hypothetical protein